MRKLKAKDFNPESLTGKIMESSHDLGGSFLLIKTLQDNEYVILLGGKNPHVDLLAAWLFLNYPKGRVEVFGGGYYRWSIEEQTLHLRGASGTFGSLGIGMKPVIEGIEHDLGLTIYVEYEENRDEVSLETLMLRYHLEIEN